MRMRKSFNNNLYTIRSRLVTGCFLSQICNMRFYKNIDFQSWANILNNFCPKTDQKCSYHTVFFAKKMWGNLQILDEFGHI